LWRRQSEEERALSVTRGMFNRISFVAPGTKTKEFEIKKLD